MTSLTLVYYPNPIFSKKAEPINNIDQETLDLVTNLIDTMYHNNAIGLTAIHVGVLKQIIVVNIDPNHSEENLHIFINPEIVWHSDDTIVLQEGSVSFPGANLDIARPKAIKIKFINLNNNIQELLADGMLARVIQHELDHMNGNCFYQHTSKLKADLFLKKVTKHTNR
jgi:peptide deformylase